MITVTHGTPFPAVIVGGPPHSGKSVFVYSLTRVLRDRRVAHYVLRACPDGEGDWANEADQQLVQEIRAKGDFSRAFMSAVAEQLQQRHLPLLVDVGGKPTPWQEAAFAYCTHAILLIGDRRDDPEAYDRDLATWQAIMARQQIAVLAVLRSRLDGVTTVEQTTPLLTGTVTGLERGQTVSGPVLSAVADQLQALFEYDEATLTKLHLAQAPVTETVTLPALARQLGAKAGQWTPQMLPRLAAAVPDRVPLAVYGRGPNWVYGLLAAQALPAPVWLFDARLGWIQPPLLPLLSETPGEDQVQAGWVVTLISEDGIDILTMGTESQYLSREQPAGLPLRLPPPGRGLVLSGKVPNWLLAAAVRQLSPAATWTAIFQPPLGGAVVVASKDTAVPVGHIVFLSGE